MKSKKALRELPLQELTIRKYETPTNAKNTELVKKFLLSLGLMQPGESRDVIVPIFNHLLRLKSKKKSCTIVQLVKALKSRDGASEPNIRRQLRRLKELKLVEKNNGGYRITEFGKLEPVVDDFIIQFLINPTAARIKDYAKKLDSKF